MIDCYCDYVPVDVHRARKVRARKPYRCEECGKRIAVGEVHEYVFAVYDGDPSQFRTCAHCLDIRQFVQNNIPCFCWAYGNLIDDAREAIDAAYWRAKEEVRGLAFGFGRLLVKSKRARAAT